ncbi:MAG: UrcA family protein [Pseudomonadota bacterium]
MFRISSALVASMLMANLACANESGKFTAEIEYDPALLTSEAGAAQVLASLEEQADDLCLVDVIYVSRPIVDRECAKSLVAQSVEKIADAKLSDTYAGTINTF